MTGQTLSPPPRFRRFLAAGGIAVSLGFLLVGCSLLGETSTRKIINAERPLGPYSGAVQADGTLYLSGQLGLDPTSGNLVEGGVAAETHQVLRNLGTVLEKAGYTFDDVVRCVVFLTDIEDYAEMNAVYAQYFSTSPPSRACVEVSDLVRGAKVEISCIAVQ